MIGLSLDHVGYGIADMGRFIAVGGGYNVQYYRNVNSNEWMD